MPKIVIIHFQPLELYPPIMNLLGFLSSKGVSKKDVTVFSTFDKFYKQDYFNSENIHIKRIGGISKPMCPSMRLVQYIIFNIITLMHLIRIKPRNILYYETLSCWAGLVYKKIFNSKVKILAHYHEYTSIQEYINGPNFVKKLWEYEKKNFPLVDIISHTNAKRLSLFQEDNQDVSFNSFMVLPNYPPKSWWLDTKHKRQKTGISRCVYVGALGLESMYLKEFCEWLTMQKNKITLDIYTINIADDARNYLKDMVGAEVNMKGGIAYQSLPKVLANYDVGLILYKGVSSNHIYSEPNKLFEYLACNLSVVFPDELIGCYKFIEEHHFPLVLKVDFRNPSDIERTFQNISNRKSVHTVKDFSFCSEQVYEKLWVKLLNN